MEKTVGMKLPSERSFGFVFATFFILVGTFPMLSDHSPRLWSLVLAAVIGFVAVVSPRVLAIPNKVWARFGFLMSRITEPIFLGLVYFLIITPFGLVIRTFGFDLLKLKRKSQSESYWLNREEKSEKENMRFQF